MKHILAVLLSVCLLACSTENRNQIPLFNELVFKMHNGEAIGDINPQVIKQYSGYFKNQLIQVPLYKYIKHKNYEIFIGIPYNTSIESLVKNQVENQDSATVYFKNDSLHYYKKYKKDDFYITEYASEIEKRSLIYISTMTNSREFSDSLFSESELSKRISTDKE